MDLRTVSKIISAFVVVSLLANCKKDHRVLGVDVQPSTDSLNAEYIPGIPVSGHSLPYDSVVCFNSKYQFLGSNNDPQFGRSDIGLYLNSSINVSNLDFGANARISSAEMVFAIDNLAYAGDKNAVLTYSIFPLTDALDDTKRYYNSDARHHSTTPISTASAAFTVASNGQTVLRIKVDSIYAESLLHDTPNLVSNDAYRAKYKGYYIAASTTGGAEGVIYTLNLDDDLSGFYLHYKAGTAATDTLQHFKFPFATGSGISRYNTLKFTPSGALQNQFADSTLGASGLYLKGMGVSRVKLEIPFLKSYTDSFKIAVNRAELVLNVDPSFLGTGNYLTPPKLILLSRDETGREGFVQDLLTSTDYARFDGTYDSDNKRYVFNIAREAQLIFDGKKANRGFYLVVANADGISLVPDYVGSTKELLWVRRDAYYERVVLAGSGNAQLKPVLNLNFVRFKND